MAMLRRTTLTKAPVRLIALALSLTICAAAAGQNYFGSAAVQARKVFNDKWTLRIDGQFGHEESAARSNVVQCAAGIGYSLSNEVVIAIYNKTSFARYMHMDNRDTEIGISESVSWRRASGLFFGFYFEQKRLFYKPSDYAKNVSCCGGIVGVRKRWEKPGIEGGIGCQVVANMKSPNTKADVIQRIKLPIVLRKVLTERTALSLSYTYGAMGSDQRYIGDRDRMNAVTLRVDITL